MAINAALLSGLALLAQAAAPPAPVVLSCSLPTRPAIGAPPAAVERIFRVGPRSFQEWSATEHRFGKNLCEAFACARTADKMEGSVSSASVSYTVGIATGGRAYWRAAGATGLAAKQGSCRVVTAPTPAHP